MGNIKIILLLQANAFLFTIAAGINAATFSFWLYQNNINESLIGLFGSIEIAAGIFFSLFLYNISKKIGKVKLIIILAAIEAIIIATLPLIFPFYINFSFVLILGFLIGICWFGIITLRQSWLNILANNSNRSIIMAIFSTMLCAGFTLGPLIIKMIGAGNYNLFLISAFITFFSCLFLVLIKENEPILNESKVSYFSIIRSQKNIFFARFLIDFQGAIVILFIVIYGINNNLSAEDSGILLSAFMIIGLFDIFIGWLIKDKNLEKIINFGFVGCFITILFLPIAINNFYLAIILFMIYGWLMSLLFISLMTAINQIDGEKNNNRIVSVNSSFQAFGALGALPGTLLTGILMDLVGSYGFIIMIFAANLAWFTKRPIIKIFVILKKMISPFYWEQNNFK